jgi:hypothetical protein
MSTSLVTYKECHVARLRLFEAEITAIQHQTRETVILAHNPVLHITEIGLNRYAVLGRTTFQTITSYP